MNDLTPRQIDILKRIIEEYTNTAQPVGSETLEKKYDLPFSPATIRNEMAEMARLGYLVQPHTSAGRIPTSKALKLYINELMKEKELTVAEEVEAKEKVWDAREDESRFLREITRALSQKTKFFSFSTTDRGDTYFSGYSYILDMPEFYDIDITKNFLTLVDECERYFEHILTRMEGDPAILLGEELEEKLLRPYSFIFTQFRTKKDRTGSVGIVGPLRIKYEMVIPTVRYFGDLIDEVAAW
jgi:heat-inducible transcriptional repressor